MLSFTTRNATGIPSSARSISSFAIDAVRPLILSSWSEALPHVAMVVVVMIVFDALCLYGGAKAFRRAMG